MTKNEAVQIVRSVSCEVPSLRGWLRLHGVRLFAMKNGFDEIEEMAGNAIDDSYLQVGNKPAPLDSNNSFCVLNGFVVRYLGAFNGGGHGEEARFSLIIYEKVSSSFGFDHISLDKNRILDKRSGR